MSYTIGVPRETMDGERLVALIPDVVGKLIDKTRSGAAIGTKDNMALVGVLSAQLVVEQFIKGRPVDVPGAIPV